MIEMSEEKFDTLHNALNNGNIERAIRLVDGLNVSVGKNVSDPRTIGSVEKYVIEMSKLDGEELDIFFERSSKKQLVDLLFYIFDIESDHFHHGQPRKAELVDITKGVVEMKREHGDFNE